MLLHTDIPSRTQFKRLLLSRAPASVSIYLSTDPVTSNEAERIELGNLASDALDQLREADTPKPEVRAIEEELADLIDDEEFWRFQARSLAIFATPDYLITFRLPNRLQSAVEVADRFYVKPLLRTATFAQVALVLAIAQGSVRLIEVTPDLEPELVRVPDMPEDAASAARRSSLSDRAPMRRIQGSEGRKLRLTQYARKVDHALRPLLTGQDTPLILAATEPLDAIFRSVSSYPHLAPITIQGNPETTSDADLAAAARDVLDQLYKREIDEVRDLFEQRQAQDRGLLDIGDVARAATYGAVDTVLVDIDEVMHGAVDEETGAITLSQTPDAHDYGVVDEIARRVWLADGRVLAVRRDEIPEQGSVAAILRHPI